MSIRSKILFVAVYLLVSMGIVMTYSSSAIYAEHVYRNATHFLTRQLTFAVIGTCFMLFVAMIPMKFWKKQARAIILMAILLMILVFLPGVGYSAGGARRWVRLFIFNFQPVEFAKIAVCIYLSDYLTRKMKLISKGSIGVFIPPFLLVGMICFLSLLQPDLGSCFIIVVVSSILFFLAGIRLRFVFGALALLLPTFYFLIIRVPYRMSRVMAYINPWEDPQGSGFQIIQSFLAFGLGGVHGVGLGQSTQKLFYLPSGYNDFILSVIGEELGMLGVLAVMILYSVIFICGIMMVRRATNSQDKLIAISLTLLIVLQGLINMLVATGLVPTKGLPLPFVSYGGTSLVFNLMCVGLLLSIDRHIEKKERQ